MGNGFSIIGGNENTAASNEAPNSEVREECATTDTLAWRVRDQCQSARSVNSASLLLCCSFEQEEKQ